MKQILCLAIILTMVFSLKSQPVKVMLITGGHSYDTVHFLNLFDSLGDIEYAHFNQPHANQQLAGNGAEGFDVLVFYDMWRTVSEVEQQAYIDLSKKGKPFLFLHHALVSYQQWPEFEKLLGGRYVENPELPDTQQSTYRHDVWIDVEVADRQHPVTNRMKNFRIFDEVYGNYKIMPGVKPLLKTNHPQSSLVIGWENRYNASKVIYLQPGHDKNAYQSEHYRQLLKQAILYLAEGD